MPRSNWLSLCALASGLAVAAVINGEAFGHDAGGGGGAQQQNQSPKASADPSLPVSVQSDIKSIATSLAAINARADSQAQRQYDSNYLQSQKDVATYAGRMFWVALGEITITLIGVVLVGMTLKAARASAREAERAANEAKRQADTAEGVLTKLERPHLFVEAPRVTPPTELRLNPDAGITWLDQRMFEAEYDIFNYGRSPAIIKKRAASIFIGAELPETPEINPYDADTDPVVIPSEGSRKSWRVFWRGTLSDDVINRLRLRRAGGGVGGFRAFIFVQVTYDSVYGKTDEVGVIWEYLIDTNVIRPVQIRNYSYRRLGD